MRWRRNKERISKLTSKFGGQGSNETRMNHGPLQRLEATERKTIKHGTFFFSTKPVVVLEHVGDLLQRHIGAVDDAVAHLPVVVAEQRRNETHILFFLSLPTCLAEPFVLAQASRNGSAQLPHTREAQPQTCGVTGRPKCAHVAKMLCSNTTQQKRELFFWCCFFRTWRYDCVTLAITPSMSNSTARSELGSAARKACAREQRELQSTHLEERPLPSCSWRRGGRAATAGRTGAAAAPQRQQPRAASLQADRKRCAQTRQALREKEDE